MLVNREIQNNKNYAVQRTPYQKKMREVIDKRQKKLIEELDAKEAALGYYKPPTHDAMEIITQDMDSTERDNLYSQFEREQEEANTIFTEDDLQFEN